MINATITIRPRFWWPNLIFVVLASLLVVSFTLQAIIGSHADFRAGMLMWVVLIVWRGYRLNHFIRVTEQNLIIKHSGQPVIVDWAQIAGTGTLQGIMGRAMPYLILRQPYANLPEPQLRRLASADLSDQILIINPMNWSNTAKLWPLMLQRIPATNQYQVPFDFSARPRSEQRNLLIFGLVVLIALLGAFLVL